MLVSVKIRTRCQVKTTKHRQIKQVYVSQTIKYQGTNQTNLTSLGDVHDLNQWIDDNHRHDELEGCSSYRRVMFSRIASLFSRIAALVAGPVFSPSRYPLPVSLLTPPTLHLTRQLLQWPTITPYNPCRPFSLHQPRLPRWKRPIKENLGFYAPKFEDIDALQVFDRMLDAKPQPMTFVFNLLLSRIKKSRSYPTVVSLLSRMVQAGVSPDIYTYGILIDSYCRMGRIELGFMASGAMLKRCFCLNTVVLNSLLRGLCVDKKIADAALLLEIMPEMGCPPDVVTYGTLIKCCCDMDRGDLALGLLADMLKNGCNPSVVVFNTLISGLLTDKMIADAAILFNGMKDLGCLPNAVTYVILISCHCDMALVDLGHGFLADMLKRGWQLKTIVLNSLIKGLFLVNRISDAKPLFEKMKNMGCPPDVVTYNTAIKGLCCSGNTRMALELHREMENHGTDCQPNVITYNTLIDSLCKDATIKEAENLFDEMVDQGISPNVVTFCSLMDSLCKQGRVREAHRLFDSMVERGEIPNTISYNILMQGYCLAGQLEDAMGLFKSMEAKGLDHDLHSCTILIDGYCKSRRMDEAIILFRQMQNWGVKPDINVYNSFLWGLCQVGLVGRIDSFLDETANEGLPPDVVTYNTLISGLSKLGKWEQAQHIFMDMKNRGVHPNIVTFNILIDAHCKQGNLRQAVNLFNLMIQRGVEHDVVSYNTLMNGYCSVGDVDAAVRLFKDMICKGCQYDLVSLNILVKGYCRSGKIKMAERLFRVMEIEGPKPDLVTYYTLLMGLLRVGRVCDALLLYNKMHHKLRLKLDPQRSRKTFIRPIDASPMLEMQPAMSSEFPMELREMSRDTTLKYNVKRREIEACGLPLVPETLTVLPLLSTITLNMEGPDGTFAREKCNAEVAKAGSGSSAAAPLHYPGAFSLPPSENKMTYPGLDLAPSISRSAHCLAQGKVGSGFDVRAAVYDSQRCIHFSPSVISSSQSKATIR